MTWEQDSFAYADGYDDGAGKIPRSSVRAASSPHR